MTFFVICGAIGFILLLLSMFGHDGDVGSVEHGGGHDFSDSGGDQSSVSIFSFRIIVIFLTGFGAIGALSTSYGLAMLPSALWGASGGVFFAFVAWWLLNFAMKQQASSIVHTNDMVGKFGIIHTPIPQDGIGEVSVELHGQRKYVSARSKDGLPISGHSQVKIIEDTSGVLIVEKSNQSNN